MTEALKIHAWGYTGGLRPIWDQMISLCSLISTAFGAWQNLFQKQQVICVKKLRKYSKWIQENNLCSEFFHQRPQDRGDLLQSPPHSYWRSLVSLTLEYIRDWKEWKRERTKEWEKEKNIEERNLCAYQFYYFGTSSNRCIIWT